MVLPKMNNPGMILGVLSQILFQLHCSRSNYQQLKCSTGILPIFTGWLQPSTRPISKAKFTHFHSWVCPNLHSDQFPSILKLVGPIKTIYLKWGTFDTMTDKSVPCGNTAEAQDGCHWWGTVKFVESTIVTVLNELDDMFSFKTRKNSCSICLFPCATSHVLCLWLVVSLCCSYRWYKALERGSRLICKYLLVCQCKACITQNNKNSDWSVHK